mmetsp:Transcript_57414/g.186176  ORF Transcript_57414/g.186176 Transcript_57414/m.186176 type:complete len:94 (-) Transcript_57414:1379-1660(-)
MSNPADDLMSNMLKLAKLARAIEGTPSWIQDAAQTLLRKDSDMTLSAKFLCRTDVQQAVDHDNIEFWHEAALLFIVENLDILSGSSGLLAIVP